MFPGPVRAKLAPQVTNGMTACISLACLPHFRIKTIDCNRVGFTIRFTLSMTTNKFEIVVRRINKNYPREPDEQIPFQTTIHEIKEFLKIAPFQRRYNDPEFANLYQALHTRAADLYVACLKKGQSDLPSHILETLGVEEIKLYEYLRDYHFQNLAETYDIFHNPIVEKIAAGFEENNQKWKPIHFDVDIIETRDWIKACPELRFLFPKSENTNLEPSYSTSEITPSTFSLATTLCLNEDGIPHCEHSPAMILKDGTEIWWKNGYIDRDDGPAIVKPDGTQIWLKLGSVNRNGGPAIELPDGRKYWYTGGVLDNKNGPAISCPDGTELWFSSGILEKESKDITEQELSDLLYNVEVVFGTSPFFHSYTNEHGLTRHFKNGLAHRDGAPSLRKKNGDEYWFQNGIRHREDGPADTEKTGSEIWFQNGICRGSPDGLNAKKIVDKGNGVEIMYGYTNNKGQRHRDNAPASIFSTGEEIWYQNGKKHREDGPAMTDIDGTQHWFILDLKHRDDGPATISPNGQKEWWVGGKIHRLGAPAVICANGDEHWYFEGQKHRDDGPAVTMANEGQSWIKHGKLHRDNDLPAIIKPDGTKYWYKDGQLHREDGPAAVFIDGSEQWLKNGKFHRIDGPAIRNTKSIIEAWYVDGKAHREDGPAVFMITGIKEWWVGDKLHRLDGPAIELPNGNEYWYKDGLKHRDGDLPAISIEHGQKLCWLQNGKLHRENNPAVLFFDGHQEWWLEGLKHRTNGPAIIYSDGRQEWWINGNLQTPEDIRNRIKLLGIGESLDESKLVFPDEKTSSAGENITGYSSTTAKILQFPGKEK